MAQTPRTSGTSNGVGSYGALVSTLRTNGAVGSSISATDWNDLITALNDFITHTHDVTDYTQQITFGDGVGGSNTFTNEVTNQPITTFGGGSLTSITSVSAGDTITVVKKNQMRLLAESLDDHYHTWDDDPS